MQILLYIVYGITVIYGSYFVITSLISFKKKKKKIEEHKPKYRLAVIIPARNEEKVIGNLVESLNQSRYPKKLYDIYVIPNNCTDCTEKVAKENEAKIIKCKNKITNKADAMVEAFNQLKNKNYDAYVIFDADNVVHPNFLSRMNDTLCEGYKVAGGLRDSKNPKDNWVSGCSSMYYYIMNFFFNRSRMEKRNTSVISGTGFMIKKEVLEEIGFNTVTLIEDLEFTTQCVLNNFDIVFVDDAITYDEQPVIFVETWKQRKRWAKGFYQCLRVYFKDLVKKIFKEKSFNSFDVLMIMLAPLIQVISTSLIAILTLLILLRWGHLTTFIFSAAIGAVIMYIVVVILCIISVKKNHQKCSNIIWGIITFPLFLITWIPIMFVALFRKNIKWEQITHDRSISINNVQK